MPRPGWYPDPTGRFEHRYHNGVAWTADVAVGGTRYVDPVDPRRLPLGAGPGSPPPTWTAGRTPGNGLAVAAMVCGITGLALAWIPFLFVAGLAASLVGAALGVAGLRRSRRLAGRGRGFAVAGLATGSAGVAVSGLGVWLTVVFLRAFDDYERPEPFDVRLTACTAAGGRIEAEGEIVNEGDDRQTYTITVDLDGGAGQATNRRQVQVDDVAPGERRSFGLDTFATGGEPRCEIVRIRGPLPFGVDPDG